MLWLLILSVFAFVILYMVTTVLIGVWIYRDAKKRDMDAVLWTLLAILLPSFIGVIVYFASRTKEKLYSCPRCGGRVKEDYAFCPKCSLQFKRKCKSCGLTCDERWTACPRCSEALEPIAYPLAKPLEQKDHLIRNIVLLVVANIIMFAGVLTGTFVFLFNNPDLIEEFQMPYTEEFDDFGIYTGKIDIDLR